MGGLNMLNKRINVLGKKREHTI